MPFLRRRRTKAKASQGPMTPADPPTADSTPTQYSTPLHPATTKASSSTMSKWAKWMSCLTRAPSSSSSSTSGRRRTKRLKDNRNSFVIDRVLFSHDGQPLRTIPHQTAPLNNDSAVSLAPETTRPNDAATHARTATNDSAGPVHKRLSSTSQSFASRSINLKRVLKPTDPTAPLPQPEPHWPQQPPTPVEPVTPHRRQHGTRPSAMTVARALNIPPPPIPPPSSMPPVPNLPPHVVAAHLEQQTQSAGNGRDSPVVGFRRSNGAVGTPSGPVNETVVKLGSRPARPTGMVFLPPYFGDEQQHSTLSLLGRMENGQTPALANVQEEPEAEQSYRQQDRADSAQVHGQQSQQRPQPFVLPSIESSLSQSLGTQQQHTDRPLSIVFPTRALPPHSYDAELPAGYRRDHASHAYAYGSAGRQRPLSMAIPSSYSSLETTSDGMLPSSWGREVLNAGDADQPIGFRRPSAYQQRPRPTSLLAQAHHQAAAQRHEYHQLESPVDPPSSYDSTNDPIVGFRRSYGGSLQRSMGRPISVPNMHVFSAAASAAGGQENMAPVFPSLRPARHLPRSTSQHAYSSSVPQSGLQQRYQNHASEYASSVASSGNHNGTPRSTSRRASAGAFGPSGSGSLLRMPSLNSIRNTPLMMSADMHMHGYSRSRTGSNASSHRRPASYMAPRSSLLSRELASQSVLPPYAGPGLSYWPLDLGLPLTSVQVSAKMHMYSRTKADDQADSYGLAALLDTWTDLHTRLAHIVEDQVGRVGARVSTCHAMQAALTHIAAPLAHRNVAATHSTFVATHVPDLSGDFTCMPLPECGGAPSIVSTHSVFVALDAAAPSALVKYIAPLADHGAQAVATALSMPGGPTEDLDNWVSEYLLFWIRLKRERPGVAAFAFAPFSVLSDPAAAAMAEIVGGGAAASPNKAGAAGNNGSSVVVQGTLVPGLWDARKAMLVAPAAVWVK